jgi:hypothetical protein
MGIADLSHSRLSRLTLLAVGAALLLGLSFALVGKPQVQLPPGVVAQVNGEPISTDRYFEALAALQAQERGPRLTADRRRRVLDDMVARELLSQEAARQQVWAQPGQEVDRFLDGLVPQEDPMDTELRAFYEAHPDRFATRRSFAVDTRWFAGLDSAARAAEALVLLDRGQPVVGDSPPLPVPAGHVPTRTLRHYVGPTAAALLETEPVGVWSRPVEVPGGHWLVRSRDVVVTSRPDFEAVRSSVLAVFLREQRAQATEARVAALLKSARISIDHAKLDAPIPADQLARAQRRER